MVVAGRLSAEKRPDLAIETLRALRAEGVDGELTVVGDGAMRPALARLARDLPVRFVGHLRDRAAVAAALVAVAAAAPAEVVAAHPGAGTSAGPDPAAFARAVARLSGTPHRRDAARVCAEAYPWSATVATITATG